MFPLLSFTFVSTVDQFPKYDIFQWYGIEYKSATEI